MPKGFLYILSNPAIPGLLKIGFSTKVPTERAAELSTTGVPAPFEVEYYCLVADPAMVEAVVHSSLAAYRKSTDREFFKVECSHAIEQIEQTIPQREHTWYRVPPKPRRPSMVYCKGCGAGYAHAEHCPKCRIRLVW